MRLKKGVLAFLVLVILIVSALILFLFYDGSLKPVDKSNTEEITITIESGDYLGNIITSLKKKDLIRSELCSKIYTKLNNYKVQAGTYKFTKAMSSQEIFKNLNDGNTFKDTISFTFIEGKRLTHLASSIESTFGYSKEEVLNVLDDRDYINELMGKYDFLSENILDSKVYHPLEGYLYPDTYEFKKDASIKDIIERLLYTMSTKLEDLNSDITASGKSVHELLTMASIVELEGNNIEDRNGIATVFMNRIKYGMTLGSDVTTYYAVNKEMTDPLTMSDLNSCNGYNTRGLCVKGLPVGPICSVSFSTIKAVLNPMDGEYLYFVADKNGKIYYAKTESEHLSIINKLKSNNLWFEY